MNAIQLLKKHLLLNWVHPKMKINSLLFQNIMTSVVYCGEIHNVTGLEESIYERVYNIIFLFEWIIPLNQISVILCTLVLYKIKCCFVGFPLTYNISATEPIETHIDHNGSIKTIISIRNS